MPLPSQDCISHPDPARRAPPSLEPGPRAGSNPVLLRPEEKLGQEEAPDRVVLP